MEIGKSLRVSVFRSLGSVVSSLIKSGCISIEHSLKISAYNEIQRHIKTDIR